MSNETTPAELQPIYEQLRMGDARMKVIEDQLADNTTITQEIRDILDAAKMGLRFVGSLGVFLRWASAIAAGAAAVWALLHGATPK